MRLESTQVDLLVHGFSLAGADGQNVSFWLWPLESLQPGQNASAPGLHSQ